MSLYIIKVVVSALVIVGATELAKRVGVSWGALLASLPLTSLLVFIWLYIDTGDTNTIALLSWRIFWLVLPSLTLFAVFPLLLKRGFSFAVALGLAIAVMAAAYVVTAAIVRRFGVNI